MASKIFDTTRITTRSLYRRYKIEYPETTLTYKQFKKIVTDTNKEIVEEALKGGVYNFGEHIGTLSIVKYNRKPYLNKEGKLRGVSPDYAATKKAKAEGKDIVIYHPSGLTCKWHWTKNSSGTYMIENKGFWSIVPTDGPKGISRMLHNYIEDNPRCTMHYKEIVINWGKAIDNVECDKLNDTASLDKESI